jgi:hypothetical protein
MGTGTNIVTHAGMRMGTGIFSNYGYREGDYSTLPIPYSLPSLSLIYLGSNTSYLSQVTILEFVQDIPNIYPINIITINPSYPEMARVSYSKVLGSILTCT